MNIEENIIIPTETLTPYGEEKLIEEMKEVKGTIVDSSPVDKQFKSNSERTIKQLVQLEQANIKAMESRILELKKKISTRKKVIQNLNKAQEIKDTL